MRGTRSVFAVLAFATVAVTSGSASAQISVLDEVTANPCADVTVTDHVVSGGCPIHATSTGTNIVLSGSHSVFTICFVEFSARVDASGHGYAYGQAIGGTNCYISLCSEADGHKEPWEIQLSEAGGTLLEMSFCLEDIFFDVETRCHLVGVDVNLDSHNVALHAEDAQCTDIEFEITGDWVTEASTVEIAHM